MCLCSLKHCRGFFFHYPSNEFCINKILLIFRTALVIQRKCIKKLLFILGDIMDTTSRVYGRCGRMVCRLVFSLFLVICTISTAYAADVHREPKLFYVSTTSTTTILSSIKICYITSKSQIKSCTSTKRRRRKRRLADIQEKYSDQPILPSR